jgi:hypothetical protein
VTVDLCRDKAVLYRVSNPQVSHLSQPTFVSHVPKSVPVLWIRNDYFFRILREDAGIELTVS